MVVQTVIVAVLILILLSQGHGKIGRPTVIYCQEGIQGLAKAAKTIGHLLHAQPISLIQRISFQYKLCLSQWCLVACHTILNYTHEPCK